MKNVLIFGATSAIAYETAKLFAENGYNISLASRNDVKNYSIKNNLISRYPNIHIACHNFNALDYSSANIIIEKSNNELGSLDIILIAHGTLPNQIEIQDDFAEIEKEFKNNALSIFNIATESAIYFEKKKSGVIVVISSVAGDRGRQSNYIYGASKGAVSIFLQGLRNRLNKSGVKVITIKPGFVDTPMTSHINKNFLFAKPENIAKGIFSAIENNKDVVYLPFFWKYIMITIKSIPESIFKKLSL